MLDAQEKRALGMRFDRLVDGLSVELLVKASMVWVGLLFEKVFDEEISGQQFDFSNWPDGASEQQKGKRVLRNVLLLPWDAASKKFSESSTKTVHAFLNNPAVKSVWREIELPELISRNVNIIIHDLTR